MRERFADPRRHRVHRVWAPRALVAVLVVVVTGLVVQVAGGGGEVGSAAPDVPLRSAGSTQPIAYDATLGEVIYRSPQANVPAPGTDRYYVSGRHCQPAEHPATGRALGKYTAWSGAWLAADGATVMHAFMQTTGPTSPYAKECDPETGQATAVSQGESFARATSAQIVRASDDGGDEWRTVHEGDVIGTNPIPFTPQPTIALRAHPSNGGREGTLLRRGNGADLQDVEGFDGPSTAFLQRLAPGAREWVDLPTRFGDGVVLDPDRFTYQFSRIRRLGDGRLVALGSVAPAGTADQGSDAYAWLLMVSSDEGATWASALTVPPGAFPSNEWDVAEIPGGGGDLLAVMRTRRDGEQIRAQARLVKGGEGTTTTTGEPNGDEGWVMEMPVQAPAELPHSGHPELLAARVGDAREPSVIIDFATTGINYTADAGRTWTPLPFPSGKQPGTRYYPRSVQTADGTVLVFAHTGADDPYRPDLAQAIVMDRFKLE